MHATPKSAKSPRTSAPFQINRRSFLGRLAATAAATGVPLWYLEQEMALAAPAPKRLGPNDRPMLGLIGCGGMGRGDGNLAQRFGDLVAVCDVDSNHAAAAAEQYGKKAKTPQIYSDFRKMLERDDLNGVIVATPDHWHTLASMAAVRAGKDVYCEKPLTLTIDEGKHLVKAVRDNSAILQTGTQQRSDKRFRLACEVVRNGRLGKLKKVTVYLPAGLREGPFKTSPVPKGLDWDLWQGQAPAVDYIEQRCHTFFRYWYEYSGGTMTDWGAHHNDIALWAIGEPGPVAVEARHLAEPIPGGYTAYSEYDVNYTYASGVLENIKTTKDDNIFGGAVNPNGQRNGIRFEGTDGWLWINRGEIDASDEAIFKTPLPENALRLYASSDHMGNWIDSMRTRKDPICDVQTGHRSAAISHLGAIALRLGKKLQWDPQKEVFVGENATEGNAMAVREMRKPYDYSYVS